MKILIVLLSVTLVGLLAWFTYLEILTTKPKPVVKPSENPTQEYFNSIPKQEAEAIRIVSKRIYQRETVQFFDIINKASKFSSTLNISGCKPSPVVIKIPYKNKLIIRNSDARAHIISVNRKYIYTIGAESSLSIVADFGFGPGVYAYSCDGSLFFKGIIYSPS